MGCNDCPYYNYSLSGQYCDKVGGITLLYGYCTDANSMDIIISNNYSKHKRKNKIERDQKYKNHLKYLAEHYKRRYLPPVMYMEEIYIPRWGYIENQKPYYKRYYRGKRSKNLKRISNKKIRRYKGDVSKNGNLSHRIYDFWCELY